MKQIVDMSPGKCPNCDGELNFARRASARNKAEAPGPGQPGICRACNALLVIVGAGIMRMATPTDKARIMAANPDAEAILATTIVSYED